MDSLKVVSPFDQSFIEELKYESSQVVEEKLASAYAFYQLREQWLAANDRRKLLIKFKELVKKHKEELIFIAAREGGKPIVDTRVEVERGITGIEAAITHIPLMLGREIPMNLNESSAHRMAYTYREPIGVVFAISAFNHPVNLIIHQVIPAIATGCPVLVKPSTSTPISCLHLVKFLHEAGVPQAMVQTVLCKNEVAEQVVSDSRIAFLSFIGSSKVGWYLRSKLAPGARCALEHGGAAPVIVEQDADLDSCLPSLLKGGFYHAGQVCVSVQRVFVHSKIIKSVSRKLADKADKLHVGEPLDEKTDVGPLISPKEVKRVDDWVQQAVTKGAKLLCGGKALSETCYAPTVLLDPPQDVNVSQYEIFGPVVCLYSYKDRQQAIELANSLPLSFQAAVMTSDINNALDCVKQLNATAVMVNDHTAFRVDWMPFGGRLQSGLGMGGIPESMDDLTFEKMMVIKSPVL